MRLLLRMLRAVFARLQDRRIARQFLSRALLVAAIGYLAITGYHAMYQPFFVGQGREELDVGWEDLPREGFKFEGAKWFHRTRLEPHDGRSSASFTARGSVGEDGRAAP